VSLFCSCWHALVAAQPHAATFAAIMGVGAYSLVSVRRHYSLQQGRRDDTYLLRGARLAMIEPRLTSTPNS
jgi:hypothetical protein